MTLTKYENYLGEVVEVLVPYKSERMLPKYSDEEFEEVARSVGLTSPELRIVHAALYQVYGYIGADLQPEGNRISREDLIEICNDAGRPETIAGDNLTPELVDWFRNKATKYPLEVVYSSMAIAFPYPEYE